MMLAALFGVAILAQATAPFARLSLPPGGIDLPMEDFGGRPVVEVRVNGRTHRFLLDTGAQGSVIDSALAAEDKLPVVGEQRVGSPGGPVARVQIVHVERLELGAASVTLDLPAINLRAILRGAANAPGGVLSAALFGDALLTLDNPASRLRVGPGSIGEPNGRDILRFDPRARLPTVPVVVADRTFTVDLDSGSPATLTLPLAYADSLPLQTRPVSVGTRRRAGGEIAAYSARLNGHVRLGPLTLDNPEITFLDIPATTLGNVGQGLLTKLVVTLDRAHGRVRLELPPTRPGRP